MKGHTEREFIPNITTDHALGRWLVEQGHLDVPDHLRPHLNYDSVGAEYRNGHEGAFTAGGYAGISDNSPIQAETPGQIILTLMSGDSGDSLILPATEEQLDDTKNALEIDDFSQAVIASAEYTLPCLNQLIPMDFITVEDANALAECLQEMEREDGELMKFCAALVAEKVVTFQEAVNIAMDRDDYELVPEDMDEYGKQVLRRAGADDEVIDTVEGYMNFAQLGEDSLEDDGVRRTEFGLVRRLSTPFPEQSEMGQQML